MRNGLAGSKAGKSRTAKFYHDNPDAAKKRDEYNKEYNSTEKRKKYRASSFRTRTKISREKNYFRTKKSTKKIRFTA